MPSWKGAVPSADAQFEAKRDALLREAAASFNRKGYHGTSLTEIAAKLGVSKAALYTYVQSKDELLYYCHEVALDAAFAGLDQARRQGGSALDQLFGTLRNYLELILANQTSHVILLEEHALTAAHVKAVIRRRDRFEAELRALVEAGMRDGSIVQCNPKLAVFAALGAINWVQKWYSPGGSWSSEQLSAALTEMLERMLSSRPAAGLPADPAAARPAGHGRQTDHAVS